MSNDVTTSIDELEESVAAASDGTESGVEAKTDNLQIVETSVKDNSANVGTSASDSSTDVEADLGAVAVSTSTGDYNGLSNKPQINDVTLQGNKTFEELGDNIMSAEEIRQAVDTAFNAIFGG